MKKSGREEILYQHGYEEFSHEGYDNASINSIIEKSGISKGSFYYRFSGKEDFYLFLAKMAFNEKLRILRDLVSKNGTSGDIFDIIKVQARALVEYAFSDRVMYNFSRSFYKEKGKEIYKKVLSLHNGNMDAMLVEMVSAAYEKGKLRNDLPVDFIVKAFLHYFSTLPDLLDMFGNIDDKEKLLQYCLFFIETLKNGLGKK